MSNKEIRSICTDDAELRSVEGTRQIEGYAIVFNKSSVLIRSEGAPFYEVVLPEAVDGVLEKSDVFALLDHDKKRGVLARSYNRSGSLTLTQDSKGIKYSFSAPNTPLGDEVVEAVRRGDLRGSSFSFTVMNDGATMERRSDGTRLRTIRKFNSIQDISVVYNAAYQDTSVALRSLEELEASEKEEERKLAEEAIIDEPIVGVSEAEIAIAPEVDYSEFERRINNLKTS